jgi:ABC-type cobalamin/Fe3+-siderophores transport system ATPase subunit
MFRLKSVYIKDYKNIQDQTFDFSTNTGYIALIGLNGSGKSNLLEAISIIFNDLYGIAHSEQVNGYSITFQLNDKDYTYATVDDTEEHNLVPLSAVDKGNLPSSVIACYSGEDLRLWHMAYEQYYMQYFKNAVRDKSFSPQIVYINKYCWKIAFISLLCSTKDTVKEFLKNVFSIDDIISVDIHIEADAEKREKFADHAACRWYDRIKELQDEDDHQLINARTLATTDMMIYGAQNADIAPYYVFQYLYLLALPEKNVEKGQAIDKLITDLDISINGVSFDNLSEGEKKLILIETITQILGDENSLVLLDEPDAHVHIENKKAILETITQYNGQTILTTHSPVFANNFKDSNIFYIDSGALFDKEKADIVSLISNRGIDVVNGACIVSAKYVIVVEGTGDINYLSKAIEHLLPANPQYAQFRNVGFIPQGSADHTESFYNDIISKLPPSVEKIIYLFDNDKPGTLNAGKINGKPKVSTILYKPYYDKPFANTFYIEDYIPTKYYPENFAQTLFDLSTTGDVKYHQLKDVLALANDLKGKATKIKKETQQHIKKMDANDFVNFKPLLDEIINQIATT